MPHLLESSRRFELLVARLADSRFILPLGGVARSFDRGSELERNSNESVSRKQHLMEQITHIITMVESIG